MNLAGPAGIRCMGAYRRKPINTATDRSIVDRARHGDLDAFEQLVRTRMDAVYRLSYAILGDEADARDAAQETFVAAWRQLPKLRDVDRFDAWFQRVAVNAARMTLRARGRRRVREIPAVEVTAFVETVAAPSDADRLEAALRRLSIEQREILALHHLDGRPLTELAEILDVPVGTVKSRLHTARVALQLALDDPEADR